MIFGMAMLAYFAATARFRASIAAGHHHRRPDRMRNRRPCCFFRQCSDRNARNYALPATFAVFALQLLLGVPIGFVL